MKYTAFQEQRFRSSVSKALQQVQKILDTTRNPVLAGDDVDQHKYDDKYALAEFLTNTSIASQINALERLGLDSAKLAQVTKWVNEDKKAATLRFQAKDSCKFLKEQEVDVVSQELQMETTKTSSPGSGVIGKLRRSSKAEKFESRIIRKFKEYHWLVEVEYSLFVYCGNKPHDFNVELMTRNTSTVLITSGGQAPTPCSGKGNVPIPPIPQATSHAPIDFNLTWFFKMISPKNQACRFAIDRNENCKTPRRNVNVEEAVKFNNALYDWCSNTQRFLAQRMEKEIMVKHDPVEGGKPSTEASKKSPPSAKSVMPLEPGTRCTIVGLQKEPTFNGKAVLVRDVVQEQDRYRVEPVNRESAGLPITLLIKAPNLKVEALPPSATSLAIASTPPLSSITTSSLFCPVVPLMENGSILSVGDVSDFLSEQVRAMDEMADEIAMSFPLHKTKLVSITEATVVLVCLHLQDLALLYCDSIDYIEDVLKTQLCQAIGKEVQVNDFDEFIRFHSQKLFAPQYAPKPFSYAIRRNMHHYPDGILSIEGTREKNVPIETLSRCFRGKDRTPISIPISASTSVQITGDRYLHGWIQHQFHSEPRDDYKLIARARQFSSFMLIVGNMAGPDKFDARDAIILQNKDEVLIPLLCSVLPTAKEFKDAVVSLSPEQRAFAESFRAMQLESSVFGVCIVQLKPQLEKLLGLPEGALTKEIQLTQDLMSLFVEYQIPSDLLALDGFSGADAVIDGGDVAAKVASVKGFVKSVMDVIDGFKEKQLLNETMKADMRKRKESDSEEESDSGEERDFKKYVPARNPARKSKALRKVLCSSRVRACAVAEDVHETMCCLDSLDSPMDDIRMEDVLMASCMSSDNKADVTNMLGLSKKKKKSSGKSSRKDKDSAGGTKTTTARFESTAPSEVFPATPSDLELANSEDFTLIPKFLDAKLEKHDSDNALRSTIIKAGSKWTRNRQENLLMPMKAESLSPDRTEPEKKKAFDMLDAISRSGTLPIDCSELHVVVGVTHCFDNDVIGTIVQDNINPIEKVEKSALMIGGTIFGEGPGGMIENDVEVERLAEVFPALFSED